MNKMTREEADKLLKTAWPVTRDGNNSYALDNLEEAGYIEESPLEVARKNWVNSYKRDSAECIGYIGQLTKGIKERDEKIKFLEGTLNSKPCKA